MQLLPTNWSWTSIHSQSYVQRHFEDLLLLDPRPLARPAPHEDPLPGVHRPPGQDPHVYRRPAPRSPKILKKQRQSARERSPSFAKMKLCIFVFANHKAVLFNRDRVQLVLDLFCASFSSRRPPPTIVALRAWTFFLIAFVWGRSWSVVVQNKMLLQMVGARRWPVAVCSFRRWHARTGIFKFDIFI